MELAEARLVSDNSSEESTEAPDTIRVVLGPTVKICSFAEFLREYVPSLDVPSLLDTPMSSMDRNLLYQMRISPFENLEPIARVSTRRDESLSSLVDDVVWCLVQRGERHKRVKQDGRNVLSLGYAIASYYQSSGAQSSIHMPAGVLMMHLNTNVDYCKTSALFKLLHRIVGDDVLRTLLLNTSVFVPIEEDFSQPRGNFFQLSGPPVRARSLKSESLSLLQTTRKRKRRQKAETSHHEEPTLREELEPHATISRRMLFYSNTYVPAVGLPHTHILNGPCQPMALLERMVGLYKCSKNAQRKRRKRLRETGTALCSEIFRRHQRCDYNRLLQRYCPLPDCCRNKEALLTDFVTASTPGKGVISFLSAVLQRVFPPEFLGSQANFDQFLNHSVVTFVHLRRREELCNKALLHGIRVTKISWLFGNRKGSISRTDHETAELILLYVLRWVFEKFLVPLLRSTFHVTESEFTGKQTLYYRKPVWSCFRNMSMNKLLKKQYTEISGRDALKRLETQEMGFSRLRLLPKATGIRPIATLCKREVLDVHSKGGGVGELGDESDEDVETPMGPARKKRKLNPSSRKNPERRVSTLPTNHVLADAFAVLSYEYSKKPETFGAGVPGLHHFYPCYRRFIERNQPKEAGARQLYFGSVDIHHCYDNIDQEHLLGIVGGILSEDDYLIQRYSVVHPFESMGRVVRRLKKQVGPPETFSSFDKMAADLARQSQQTIFVDGVACALVKKPQLMAQLREHLTSHLVTTKGRYGDRYLVQSTGIPQGSVLSSMLCNYYYGNVESKLLSEHFELSTTALRVEDDLLVRMVDDYMLVTNDVQQLRGFLTKMKTGEPSIGVRINDEKTKVSVSIQVKNDDGTDLLYAPTSPDKALLFPWCGMLFDTSTGEVRVDYTRFHDGKASDGLTIGRVKKEGDYLMAQMKTFVRPRCLPILFDSFINGRKVQIINFYQLVVLGAVKMAEYLRTSGSFDDATNVLFLIECVDSLVTLAFDLINERLKAAASGTKISISREVTVWLGWRAFDDVFRTVSHSKEFSSRIADRAASGADGESRSLRETASYALREIQLEKLLESTPA